MGDTRILRVFGAVNIGSFRVSAMIVGQDDTGAMRVLGSAHRMSEGVKRGYITELEMRQQLHCYAEDEGGESSDEDGGGRRGRSASPDPRAWGAAAAAAAGSEAAAAVGRVTFEAFVRRVLPDVERQVAQASMRSPYHLPNMSLFPC